MIRTPYLIQLANFKDKYDSTGGVDNLLQFEYMGAAEFEFNALPKTLNRLIEKFSELEVTMNKSIVKENGQRLCVISTKEDYKEYIFYINGLANPPKDDVKYSISVPIKDPVKGGRERRQLKESSHFYRNLKQNKNDHSKYGFYDVWWDIENDVIWTFGKENANKILKAIGNVKRRREEANSK